MNPLRVAQLAYGLAQSASKRAPRTVKLVKLAGGALGAHQLYAIADNKFHASTYGSHESATGVLWHQRGTNFAADLGQTGAYLDAFGKMCGVSHCYLEIPPDRHGDKQVVGQGGLGIPLEGAWDLPCVTATQITNHAGQEAKAHASMPVEQYYERQKHRKLDLDTKKLRRHLTVGTPVGRFGAPALSADHEKVVLRLCHNTLLDALHLSNRNAPHPSATDAES